MKLLCLILALTIVAMGGQNAKANKKGSKGPSGSEHSRAQIKAERTTKQILQRLVDPRSTTKWTNSRTDPSAAALVRKLNNMFARQEKYKELERAIKELNDALERNQKVQNPTKKTLLEEKKLR